MLYLAGEDITSKPLDFIYYSVITISTVGYGDFSPSTDVGKMVVAFILVPFGLLFFSSVLVKMGNSYQSLKEIVLNGDIKLRQVENHILLFGWLPNQTESIISLIRENNQKQHIALVSADKELEHPISDLKFTDYVRLENLLNQEEYGRLAIGKAKSIIVNTGDNAQNHLICVALNNYMNNLGTPVDKRPHIVVYSTDIYIQSLLANIGGKIEVVNIFREHMLSRSALFAGSSSCAEALVDPQVSATQFTLKLSDEFKETTFMELYTACKFDLDITVIGVSQEDDPIGNNLVMNPPKEMSISAGMHLFYVASHEVSALEITNQFKGK